MTEPAPDGPGWKAPKRCPISWESTASAVVLDRIAVSRHAVCTIATRPKSWVTPYLSPSHRSAAKPTSASADPIGTSRCGRCRMVPSGTPGPIVHGTTSWITKRIWKARS
jgi:hypothetical protein